MAGTPGGREQLPVTSFVHKALNAEKSFKVFANLGIVHICAIFKV